MKIDRNSKKKHFPILAGNPYYKGVVGVKLQLAQGHIT